MSRLQGSQTRKSSDIGGVVKLTPMLEQYLRAKEQYPDAILFFRLGDFYEMFFEDAERAAPILEIALTTRSKKDDVPIAMCGVPHHASQSYITKLLAAGLKVAICDQTQDVSEAKGIVERGIVRVVTPGTVTEEECLDPGTPNYLVAIASGHAEHGLAAIDLSTGEVRVSAIANDSALADEVKRCAPREVLVAAGVEGLAEKVLAISPEILVNRLDDSRFTTADADRWLEEIGAGAMARDLTPPIRAAISAALSYLGETHRAGLAHLRAPSTQGVSHRLHLDEATRRNLELLTTTRGDRRGSLLWVIDQTNTPMGGRLMRDWLLSPLADLAAIGERLDAVEQLREGHGWRTELEEELRGIGDLERLNGRLAAGRVTPRDVSGLARTLDRVGRDLVVSGDGDPSIVSPDGGIAQLFLDWADAVREAGIRQVQGRLIGDDSAFDDDVLGAGWAWDNLDAGYAAPAGALSYNENVAEVRITAGGESGSPAVVRLTPPGATLDVTGRVVTGPPGSAASVTVARALGSTRLVVNGQVPAGGPEFVRTAPVVNPTSFFVEGLAAALTARGIAVSGGAWDLDEVAGPPPPNRFRIGERQSLPLSALAGRFMKDSQNFYGEMLLKAIGRADAGLGTAENGRRGVRAILAAWGAGDDEVVMYDGSGLSRYNYVTADAIVRVLTQVWRDERLRGPFLASLPIGGVDGTLAARMTTPELHGRVQAKTGTINHVRALSGYLTRADGEKLVFSMIANHFTAPSTAIDAVVERALATLGR
jgi:PBP4 family serine-type D-alanyl-D-alanine carboxypeptidase